MINKITEENLLRAIGEIDDDLILAAEEEPPKVLHFPIKRWQRIAATAACFLLCVGVFAASTDFLRMGKSAAEAAPESPQAPQAAPPATNGTAVGDLKADSVDIEMEEEAASAEGEPESEAYTGEFPEAGIIVEMPAAPTSENSEQEKNFNYTVNVLKVEGDISKININRDVLVDGNNYREAGDPVTVLDSYMISNIYSEPVTVEVLYEDDSLVRSDEENATLRKNLTLGVGESASIKFEVKKYPAFNEETASMELTIQGSEHINSVSVTIDSYHEIKLYDMPPEKDNRITISS